MAADAEARAAEPLLDVRGLTLRYAARSIVGTAGSATAALTDVWLEMFPGKTLALVGPSGSGKSSLARSIVALERPDSGQILYQGRDLLTMPREQLKASRREIHLIFQDSASALNPRLNVEEILAEPLMIHKAAARGEGPRRIREALEQVELSEQYLARRPLDLSGGQRQRVAIARSLVLQPKLLIRDEALSALDLSTGGQIANLLLDLQGRRGLSYLYITHDLKMASLLAHHAAVMEGGRVIRQGAPRSVFTGSRQMQQQALSRETPSRETVAASLLPRG